jgi:hypothetical protein
LKRPAGGLSLCLNLVLLTVLAGVLVARQPLSETGKSMIGTTSVRNVGVSLVIATASFPGTAAVTSATAYAIFQTLTVAIVVLVRGRLTRNVPLMVRKAA